jgi:hypothetical protein
MNEKIERLLKIVDEFPIRGRIDYTDQSDLLFCNSVLAAIRDAAPAIRFAFTSQAPIVEAQVVPSSFPQALRLEEQSIRIQDSSRGMPDVPPVAGPVYTSGAAGQKSDTDNKPSPSETSPGVLAVTASEPSEQKKTAKRKSSKLKTRKKKSLSPAPIARTEEVSVQTTAQP